MIGLNPPFGKAGSLANKFVEAAAQHRPRLIVLIVPPRTVVRLVLASASAECRVSLTR